MELYVLRHAIAVTRGTEGLRHDSDRPLTQAGHAKLRRVVRGMGALGLSFDLILTSPYLRAVQTAEVVAAQLGGKNQCERTPQLAPDGDPRALVRLITSRSGDEARVLVVGHEPYLGELVSVLVAGDAYPLIDLKKAGLCKLATPALRYGRCARLEWLLTPAQAVRMQ